MPSIEVYEDASIVKAILNMAIFDAFNYKKPKKPAPFVRPVGSKKKNKHLDPNYVSTDTQYLAWDARRFLRTNNPLFCFYCGIVDIDPQYLAEKIARKVRAFDRSKKKFAQGIDFLNVNTI